MTATSGGGGGGVSPDIHQIPTYLVWSILVTLFCCLPFGIVSIVYSANVNKYKEMGDFNAAMRASNTARNWALGAAVSGIVVVVLYIIFWVLVVAGAATSAASSGS